MGRGARTSERAHVGSFWCSRRGRGRGEVREHQNEPVWARSGGRDGEGCPNIRTSLCGLVLMLETRERKSGGARAPERATHGLVLVFETRERERGGARAPECARVGTFWCSRRGGERRGVRNEGGEEGTPERAHKGTFWCPGCSA